MQKKSAGSRNLIGVRGSAEDDAAKIWSRLVVGLLSYFQKPVLRRWLSLKEEDVERGKEEDGDGGEKERGEADKRRKKAGSKEQGPPPPRAGCVPIVIMILHWGPNNEHSAPVRTLLDTGSSIPLLSITWAQPLDVPMVRRPQVKKVKDFAGEAVRGAGEFYVAKMSFCYGRIP